MKVLFLSMLLAAPMSFANDSQSESLWPIVTGNHNRSCNFWTSIRGQNGFSGYACSSYPMSAYTLEGRSLESLLRVMKQRIEALEGKVQALEEKAL